MTTDATDAKQALAQEISTLKPEEMFRTLAEIRKTAKPLEPLWGFLLFKKAITSIIGDPGVCKTTMGYGLSTSLCNGQSFLDIPPEESIKGLYMDFESSDSLIVSRANLIEVNDVPNFWIYNIVDYYLPNIADMTVRVCQEKGINLIIVDNQSMAFNTRDENDNAEAIRQMKFLRSLTNACNSATIVFHHTSKANMSGTRKGSGAFARARLADICINLDILDEDNPNIIQFSTVKNRMVDEKVLWYIKKEKGSFTFTDPPLGFSKQPTSTLLYKAQQEIMTSINGNKEYKFNELVNLLRTKNISDTDTHNALTRLVQQGRLTKPKYGYYAKADFHA
jgi:predicted ATP-dependent serine protease